MGHRETTVDLSRFSDTELAALVPSKNEWKSRHARRLLQERAAAGRISTTRDH